MDKMNTLDPSNTKFNWPNARALLNVCADTYAGPTGNPAKNDNWIDAQNTDARCLIRVFDNCLVVAFRGSKDPEDYIQDAKFGLTDLIYTDGELNAKVHTGFLEDFDSLNLDLIHDLNNKLKPNTDSFPIFITGHSLGAAQAILCALEFSRRKLNIAGVYTFGGPRVGNESFANIYNAAPTPPGILGDRTFRVVNENDIVPRVPPWFNGYRHVGELVFLTVPNGVIYDPPWYETWDSDSIGFLRAILKHTDVLGGDHHIAAYQKRIQLL